ncbi:hypothetical protein ACFV29_08430 [Streptomyces sp. NPDC059690]|uniref:hypothetical protein n=1 Tax=Streptomyces sp. NPDC059690 TaxID=3346907 RepID=UPI003681E8CF
MTVSLGTRISGLLVAGAVAVAVAAFGGDGSGGPDGPGRGDRGTVRAPAHSRPVRLPHPPPVAGR